MEAFHEKGVEVGGVFNEGSVGWVGGGVRPNWETSLTNWGR